jgi:hypothetical protein
MNATTAPSLEPLKRLVGTWTTEATHPALPGVVVRGSIVIEWLEGERFLIQRARTDHPQFPDSMSVIGFTGRDRVDGAGGAGPAGDDDARLTMHYYDSRGVFRVFEMSIDDTSWHAWRDSPGFSQRFTGTVSDDGGTIVVRSQLCRDERHWEDDLESTYRRLAGG